MFTITTGVYNTSSYREVKRYKTKRGVINFIKTIKPDSDPHYWFENGSFNVGGTTYNIRNY